MMRSNLKVIYTSYQPYALQMGIKLNQQYGWRPVYWFSDLAIDADIKKHFPEAISHNYIKAIKGIKPEQLDIEYGIVDEPLLKKLAFEESIALNMMERNDSTNSFTYKERFELYHYHLRYWTGVLNKLQPDIIVFEEEPHQAVDYVLYALAKHMNIETIMFVRTSFFGRMFPVKLFEEGSPIIKNKYRKKLVSADAAKPFAEDIAFFLEKLAGNYEEVRSIQLYDQVDKIKKLQEKPRILRILWNKVRYYITRLIKLFNLTKFKKRLNALTNAYKADLNSDQKVPGRKFNESWFSKKESNNTSRKTLKRKLELKKYYEKIANNHISLQVPYIVCALSYQPEKTTSPMGGYFANQLLMIEMIRKVMPANWKLYVKDHISQFSWYTQFGEQYRSIDFYDQIKALHNTELVPLFYDTFSLIDNCKAVATVTGSIGFEALMRNKPVFTFGHPWYKFCEGVFYAGDAEDFKNQMNQIANGYTPDQKKLSLFIETIQEETFEGIVGGQTIVKQAKEKGDPEKNAEEHIKSIISLLTYNEKH